MHRLALLVFVMGGALSCGQAPGPPRPPGPPPAPALTTLVVRVTDGPGGPPLPAKLLLYSQDPHGGLLRIGGLDYNGGSLQDRGFCTLADGAVGTWQGIALWRGEAEIPLDPKHQARCHMGPPIPPGRYRSRVLRGAEYEPFDAELDLRPGRGPVVLDAPLRRAFSTEGVLIADLHVHAQHSPDSNVPRDVRVMTEAAAGTQVIGGTDHNFNGDFNAQIQELGLAGSIASLPGNEASLDVGHFNVFPVIVAPEQPGAGALDVSRQPSAQEFFDMAHGLPGRPLVQVNHARLGFAAYFDLAGWDGIKWPPPMPVDFDALEVLSGFLAYSRPDDQRAERALGDLYTLYQHGTFMAALGNSDTHHLNAILAGFPRTYVFVGDDRTKPFDQDGFVAALRARHTVASTGPFVDLVAQGSARAGDQVTVTAGQIDLSLRLRQASFVHATRVRLWIGGEVRRTLAVPAGATSFDWHGSEPVGPADTWIGLDASGDTPLPEDLVGEYLGGVGGMLPYAVISPILVDADGDGVIKLPQAQAMGPVDLRVPHTGRAPWDCGEGM